MFWFMRMMIDSFSELGKAMVSKILLSMYLLRARTSRLTFIGSGVFRFGDFCLEDAPDTLVVLQRFVQQLIASRGVPIALAFDQFLGGLGEHARFGFTAGHRFLIDILVGFNSIA